MTSKWSQTYKIESAILNAIDMGTTNKKDIYTIVVEALGVPRPTVRRVAANLAIKLEKRVKTLSC